MADFAALSKLDLSAPAFVPSEERGPRADVGRQSGRAGQGKALQQQTGKQGRQQNSKQNNQQNHLQNKKRDKNQYQNPKNKNQNRSRNRNKNKNKNKDTNRNQNLHKQESGRRGGDCGGSQMRRPNGSMQEEKVREGERSSAASAGSDSKKKSKSKKKKNTESFNPEDYLVPPDIRVRFGPATRRYNKPYSVHDVVVAPDLFCASNDYSVYDDLLSELKASGCDSLFVSWHGDSHVIADDKKMRGSWKKQSPTFTRIVDQMRDYFDMDIKATRFNWYRDQTDWKPWHHDAAAIKPRFAKTQNITVAASFGAEREIGFEHAKTRTMISVPQPNGSMYAFGRDVNIEFRHGVVPLEGKTKKGGVNTATPGSHQSASSSRPGRISIIAWGWVDQEFHDSRVRNSP